MSTSNSRLQPAEGFIFESGKTYTHSVGLSCAFRQWRATLSHCRFLHGYSLQVTFTFRSQNLSDENWVVDFGALKSLKTWLEDQFDHKTLVAEDDPYIATFRVLQTQGVVALNVLPHVGMEAFAMYIYHFAEQWLVDNDFDHATLECVEVREHESNFARYRRNS